MTSGYGTLLTPTPRYRPYLLHMKTASAVLVTILLVACSGDTSNTSDTARPTTGAEALAEVAAAKSLPPETYTSTTAGFDLQLPGVWKGRYRAGERRDTTAGARLAVDFTFIPDSGSKASSLTLMTIRIFSKAAWAAASKRPGAPLGSKLAESAKDVYVISLPASNPYAAGTKEAPEFDKLIISIAQGGQQVHLTVR